MAGRKPYPLAKPYTDARGKRRWRINVNGKRSELGADWGSDEFQRRYEAALALGSVKGMAGANRVRPGTVDDLCARFYQSRTFKELSDSTKRNYRSIIERFRVEHGGKRVQGIMPRHINDMMAEKVDTPNAANNFRKRLGQLLDLAVDLEWMPSNPVRATKPFKVESQGIHTWSEAEIAQFFDHYQAGEIAHTAATLMLYTGAALVDAVKLGRFSIKQTEDGERLVYRRQKTQKTNGQLVSIPIHPDLREVIDRLPEIGTFLQTKYDKQRSPDGLGNDMSEWCNKAGVPACSAHGLRKACARRLAEAGASAPEIQSITGHKTLSEVQRYIADANREVMADSGMAKLIARPNGEQTLANLVDMFAKNEDRSLKNKDK